MLPGARVSAGDTILTLSSDTLDEELETLRDELESVNESLAGARQEAASRYVTAGRAGVVKEILAASGDIVDDAGALCRTPPTGTCASSLRTRRIRCGSMTPSASSSARRRPRAS